MLPKLERLSEFLDGQIENIPFVVEELLPMGGLSILSGNPKAGKSTLIRNLMRSVSRGEQFLGRETSQSIVLYYALEELPFRISTEFTDLGCHDEDIYIRAGPMEKSTITHQLREDIRDLKARLAVIDPLADILDILDINSYTQINDAMKGLLAVARYTSCHVLVVHHTNKSNRRGGNSILGSQALAGATDCNIFLTVDGNDKRIIESQQRSGTPLDRTTLKFSPDTHEIIVASTIKQNRSLAIRDSLLEALGDKTLSSTEWASVTRGKAEDKYNEMRTLEVLGIVHSTISGRNTLWQKYN